MLLLVMTEPLTPTRVSRGLILLNVALRSLTLEIYPSREESLAVLFAYPVLWGYRDDSADAAGE